MFETIGCYRLSVTAVSVVSGNNQRLMVSWQQLQSTATVYFVDHELQHQLNNQVAQFHQLSTNLCHRVASQTSILRRFSVDLKTKHVILQNTIPAVIRVSQADMQ